MKKSFPKLKGRGFSDKSKKILSEKQEPNEKLLSITPRAKKENLSHNDYLKKKISKSVNNVKNVENIDFDSNNLFLKAKQSPAMTKKISLDNAQPSSINFCTFLPQQNNSLKITPTKKLISSRSLKEKIIIKPSPKLKVKDKEKTYLKPKLKRESAHKNVIKPNVCAEKYDIIQIDREIKIFLKNKIDNVEEPKSRLSLLSTLLDQSKNELEKNLVKKKLFMLRKEIIDLETAAELGLYLYKTVSLIEEYKHISEKTHSNSFMIVRVRSDEDIKLLDRKKDIKFQYLKIAKEYINVENVLQKKQKLICHSCLGISFELTDDDSILICSNQECGNIIEIMDESPSYKDTDRINMASRYTYTCESHFKSAMDRFEGVQNVNIPQTLIDLIRNEMKNFNLLDNTVTKDHIYMILSEKGETDFYHDINLIFFMITAKPPPKITKYRNRLMEMFKVIEKMYDEIKGPDRTNSLNVDYKLYKLLQIVGYNCKKEDFYFLKTPAKLYEHDEKWKELIEILAEKYPYENDDSRPLWRFISSII
jgi:hypothetical protein